MKLFALGAEGWGMKLVELYGRVRYAVRIEGISRREAARRFGIDPQTVAKMETSIYWRAGSGECVERPWHGGRWVA